jgi:Phosphoserine phosphatase RsbU, N-terminal domain
LISSTDFRAGYLAALEQHVLDGDETTLRSGYELGRVAVAEAMSILDLAGIHHDALASTLDEKRRENPAEIVSAAGAYFQEVLSAFEMVHRGYREAAAAAAAERRHAAMLRRLSSFLADASLSARHTDAPAEVLHLVAEHARELTDATYAVASWAAWGESVRATSRDPDRGPEVDQAGLDLLEEIGIRLPRRISRARWAHERELRSVSTVSNVLSVPIAALDGRPIGLLQLVDKGSSEFTDADEAVAIHLSDMTAAALERAELYHPDHSRI